MKRLLALLLVLCLCFSLVACSGNKKKTQTQESVPTQTEEPEQPSKITPILYKATDKDGNIVYLFGSIHVGKEDFYPLPDYVMDAFESADSLAVEFDILAFEKDLSVQIQALQVLVYADGSTIDEHISEDLYNQAVAYLEEAGYYNSAFDHYIPSMWFSLVESVTMEQAGVNSSLGIDGHLLKQAYEMEKPILEVESASLQYGMLADFSEQLQILLLESALEVAKDLSLMEASMKELMDLWAAGDEENLAAYLYQEEEVDESEYGLYEEYEKALVVDRNIAMTDFAEEALASGETVFICVGAAHVVGEGAIADLLSQRGYTVERVQ